LFTGKNCIEVDCLVDLGTSLVPIEIKSGQTIVSDFFDGIGRWSQMANTDPAKSYIIYGGNTKQKRSKGTVLDWKTSGELIDSLENNRS